MGESIVLAGHNGSGKSTFLRLAAGLAEPTSGEVRVLGATAGSLEARSVTSYIGDDPVLYDDLSVSEHLEYVARLFGASEWESRSVVLMDRFGLAGRADALASRLSRGLRQKTALTIGLIRPFALLLIDEPFVGLDEQGRRALIEALTEASAAGRTVIVATHNLEYLRHAKRCIGLRDGKVAYDGPTTGSAVQELLHG